MTPISYRTWSKERPVTSGYYWCMLPDEDQIFMVLVFWDEERPEEPFVRTVCGHCEDTPMGQADEKIQWFGPLGPSLVDAIVCPNGSYLKMSSIEGIPPIE